MALWGTPAIIAQQLTPSSRFETAMIYLKEALNPDSATHARIMAVPKGETLRVELAEGVFALEQAYTSKARAEGRFEAHERHVDLQAIVAGYETMEVTTDEGLTVTENALADRDVQFFADTSEASVWKMRAGEIAVFFPADVHMPSLQTTSPTVVFKTVVKVAL
jgi:biofilm protein TabA